MLVRFSVSFTFSFVLTLAFRIIHFNGVYTYTCCCPRESESLAVNCLACFILFRNACLIKEYNLSINCSFHVRFFLLSNKICWHDQKHTHTVSKREKEIKLWTKIVRRVRTMLSPCFIIPGKYLRVRERKKLCRNWNWNYQLGIFHDSTMLQSFKLQSKIPIWDFELSIIVQLYYRWVATQGSNTLHKHLR